MRKLSTVFESISYSSGYDEKIRDSPQMKTALVLPAYNEEQYIAELVKKGSRFVDEVIVVDDCSRDQTYRRALESGAIVLHHKINLGKSSALKTGCELLLSGHATLRECDGQTGSQNGGI